MAYHKRAIKKGVPGEASKIMEEAEELMDAVEQKNPIMALIEISDMVGAIKLFLKHNHPTIAFDDVIRMADTTVSAFEDGTRK